MSKLTGKEIIEILEDNEVTVESFAFDDLEVPDSFKGSEEVQRGINEHNTAYRQFLNYGRDLAWKDKQTDPEFIRLKEVYRSIPNPHNRLVKEWLESLGIGEMQEVKQYGGEGQGDTWYSVKYFPDHDVHIRTDGFYSSYNGIDFYDGFGEEVKPVDKVVTFYE